jgi:RNA polymerase sigma factor (TIGR02999 family)
MNDLSSILLSLQQGDQHASDELLPLVYDELRRLAAQKLASESPGQTLDATALVHEAYLRLLPRSPGSAKADPCWEGRGHFFAAAAEAMRRILVERARRKHRVKHGGDMRRVDLDIAEVNGHMPDDELLALDEALDKLKAQDSAKADLVQLRFFAGLSNEEAAKMLGVSSATAKRSWRYARAWLHREMTKGANRDVH